LRKSVGTKKCCPGYRVRLRPLEPDELELPREDPLLLDPLLREEPLLEPLLRDGGE
jgi:hypothetical protein